MSVGAAAQQSRERDPRDESLDPRDDRGLFISLHSPAPIGFPASNMRVEAETLTKQHSASGKPRRRMIIMRFKPALTVACATLMAASASAQAPESAKIAVQVSENRSENAKLMRGYSWNTRTEIKSKGETQLIKVELVRYDIDGRQQKTTISEEGAKKRKKRGIRGAVQKKKGKKKQEWFKELHGLLAQYSLPTAGKVLDYLDQATFGPGDESGTLRIRGTGVIQPGDELTMVIDSESKELKLTKVRTKLDGETVHMTTNHDRLESGLNYQARSIITVPAKDVRMTVENFDYTKQ